MRSGQAAVSFPMTGRMKAMCLTRFILDPMKTAVPKNFLDECGISLEDAYVFGDSSNDLSMFRYASNCVLMGHHSPVLEPYASFVTKTVEEDGIAYAMKELGII